MITNKYMTMFVSVLMAAAVFLCFCMAAYSKRLVQGAERTGMAVSYESELFQTDQIMEVNICMEGELWEEMLEHAVSEQYYSCDVEINGTLISNIGIRPKGNTSLTAIASDPDTDRYSLKLEFDHYVDGQTCFGLDKLILNNNYADATNMKEAIVYDMYRYLETDASLYNYAKVSVNGEYRGVYLALEAVEESFLLRNYGTGNGSLYKPDNMNMGGRFGMSKGDPENGFLSPPEGAKGEEKQKKPEFSPPDRDMSTKSPDGVNPFDGKNPFDSKENFGGGGADLNYTDDEEDSYQDIWDGSVTDTGRKDHKRVITALEHIHAGEELDQYLDIENILKYMAVHTFAVNLDSLTGTMAHNYYLYEANGRLNILPWDYNLSFGGMSEGKDGGASEMINYPVDTPFLGTQFFDALLENESCAAQYHAYLEQLAREYVSAGKFAETYQRIRTQIDGLVKTDPTAFYTYDEYDAGANMLFDVVSLRAESVLGQLSGAIPATKESQKESKEAFVDASEVDVKVMGVMNMEKMEKRKENKK